MSVINQMLKELEQRNETDSSERAASSVYKAEKKAGKGKIVAIVIVILLINILGLYIWNLYSENKRLKSAFNTASSEASKNIESPIKRQLVTKKNVVSLTPNRQTAANVTPNNSNENVATNTQLAAQKKINESQQALVDVQQHAELTNSSLPNALPGALHNKPLQNKPVQNKRNIKKHTSLKNNAFNNNTLSTPNRTNTNAANSINNSNNTIVSPLANQKSAPEPVKPSLSISRSKLSPAQVVKNKMQKAERAMIDNKIPKAEQLFEDVLLIQPENKEARKQLSALWFGRKLYRPALNLLSKGVEVFPKDIDFRIMMARILLSQNNHQQAFTVLNSLADANNTEYQVLLANAAQSSGYNKSVISAYQKLIALETHKGKWWMGLAVALDQDSQFSLANEAYQMALSKNNLSNNSAQFVRQRIIELGD